LALAGPSKAAAVLQAAMAWSSSPEAKVRLDLSNPVFQEQLLTLQKVERHAVLDTLNKIR
jgi:hypothetical protein